MKVYPKKWNIWLRRLIFSILLFFSVTTSLAIWLNEFLRQQLGILIYYQSEQLYTVSFSDIDVNPFTLTASVQDLQIIASPDSVKHSHQKVFINGSVENISLSGISLYEMFVNEILFIYKLSIYKPFVTVTKNSHFTPRIEKPKKKIAVEFHTSEIHDANFNWSNSEINQVNFKIGSLLYLASEKKAVIKNPWINLSHHDSTHIKAYFDQIQINGFTLEEMVSEDTRSELVIETKGLTAKIDQILPSHPNDSSTNGFDITSLDPYFGQLNNIKINLLDNEFLVSNNTSSLQLKGGRFTLDNTIIQMESWYFSTYEAYFKTLQSSGKIELLNIKYNTFIKEGIQRAALFEKIEIIGADYFYKTSENKIITDSISQPENKVIHESIEPIQQTKNIGQQEKNVLQPIIPGLSFLFDTVTIKKAKIHLQSGKNELQITGLSMNAVQEGKKLEDMFFPIEPSLSIHIDETKINLNGDQVIRFNNFNFDNNLRHLDLDTLNYRDVCKASDYSQNPISIKIHHIQAKLSPVSTNKLLYIDSLSISGGKSKFEKKFQAQKKPLNLHLKPPFYLKHLSIKNTNFTFVRNMKFEPEKNGTYDFKKISAIGRHLSNRSIKPQQQNQSISFSFLLRSLNANGDLHFNLSDPDFNHTLNATTKSVKLSDFNSELEALAGIQVDEGIINSLDLHISGNKDEVKSNIKIIYSELTLKVLRNKDQFKSLSEGEERNYKLFLTNILNKTIKDSNLDSKVKNGISMQVKTDPNKTIINTWVRTVLLSTVQTIIPATHTIFDLKSRLDQRKQKRKEKREKRRNKEKE